MFLYRGERGRSQRLGLGQKLADPSILFFIAAFHICFPLSGLTSTAAEVLVGASFLFFVSLEPTRMGCELKHSNNWPVFAQGN